MCVFLQKTGIFFYEIMVQQASARAEMVTLKMEYETNNKIVRDFECSEITDTELFELKENKKK